jgi:hypothetical protein
VLGHVHCLWGSARLLSLFVDAGGSPLLPAGGGLCLLFVGCCHHQQDHKLVGTARATWPRPPTPPSCQA